MNNVCECREEIELKEGQPTLMDIYEKLNKLEIDNRMLKANNYELQKENMQLRSDNLVLHNKINENSQYTTMIDGGNDLSYMDEYAKGNEELEIELAKMYEVTSDNYKFGGRDLKEL